MNVTFVEFFHFDSNNAHKNIDNSFVLEVYQKLGEAEEQAENGIPNVNGREVFDRFRMKHGRQTI